MRGNGKIIQELEGIFRGAGWNVIKVIWGDDWDPLLAKDKHGLLVKRMGEVVDGEYQKYTVMPGEYIREHFFGKYPELLQMVAHCPTKSCKKLRRGGHDPEKVYAAYKAAVECKGQPTVILAKTIKGYGLGEAGEGRNVTHQQKKLNEEELREFRSRFGIPISDEEVAKAPFYKPPKTARRCKYLQDAPQGAGRLRAQSRSTEPVRSEMPRLDDYKEFLEGSGEREASTTMAFVGFLTQAAQGQEDRQVHRADRARRIAHVRHGRRCSARSASTPTSGQLYEPVDSRACSRTTAKPRTARFSKKASPKPARCRRSSPPAPPTPRTGST